MTKSLKVRAGVVDRDPGLVDELQIDGGQAPLLAFRGHEDVRSRLRVTVLHTKRETAPRACVSRVLAG